ncbi:MAG: hypothetical protein D6816_13480 [Bacteroidetes bacterium]|nr:MAG: hypothetical protein D6816_13480 [Bacteroidota bacterium]
MLLLAVPYFLLIFTIPAALRPLARSQWTLVYNLLFHAVAAATQQLRKTPALLAARWG